MPAPPTVTNSPTPPLAPAEGDLWFNTTTGREYVWYTSPGTGLGAWVQTQPTGGTTPTQPPVDVPSVTPPSTGPYDVTRVPTQTVSAVPPVTPAPINGDLWWNTRTGQEFIYYDDGNTQQWVLANRGNGLTGDAGDDAFTRTTATFIMPAVGANVPVPVIDNSFYKVGQSVFVEDTGYFAVYGLLPGFVGLTNIGAPGNAPPTTVIASGAALLIAGPVGVGSPPYGPAGGVLSDLYPNPGFAPDPEFDGSLTADYIFAGINPFAGWDDGSWGRLVVGGPGMTIGDGTNDQSLFLYFHTDGVPWAIYTAGSHYPVPGLENGLLIMNDSSTGKLLLTEDGNLTIGGPEAEFGRGVINAIGDNGTAQGYAVPHFNAKGIFPSYYMTSTVADLTNVNDYGGAFYLNDPADNLIGYLGFGTTGTMPFAQFGVTGTFGGHGAFFNAFDDGSIVLQGLIARFGSDFNGSVPIPVEMGSLDALGFIRLRAAGYPKFWWNDTSGAVDAKKWQAYVMPDGGWRLGAINDAETAESGGINVHRDGTVNFATPSFGAIGTEGVTAAWVGHAIGSIVFPPPPTTLPPNGPAGGDLAGTYPNPTIGNGKVTPAKIAPSATNGQVLTTVAGAVAWAAAAGGTTISIGVAPPASPAAGALWWFSDGSAGGGQLYIFYDDGNSQQWVPAAAAAGPITPPVFTKSFVSTPQAIVAAGLISLAHGFGTKPLITNIRLRCIVAELGYAVGQEPEWFSGEGNTGGTSGRGCAIWSDGVNVNCRVASATTPLEIINATTGGFAVLTLANWAIILSAFA